MNGRSMLVAATLLLSACNDSETPANTNNLQLNLRAVPQSHLAVCDLSATVSVDRADPVVLTVNADDSISGRVDNVPVGDRDIRIVVECDHSTFGDVELASADLSVTVGGGTNRISFTLADYNYTNSDCFSNDDCDVYNNLQEVVAGSDPFDTSSLPGDGTVPAGGYWRTMLWRQSNWR